ncbi:Pr6Pr family membrane protein [Micrococcus sp. M4NT]|uniref:Pr6Pr family membrane protein n=1 Tax=Micrococcus sp. M4NT TaxID=2957501 RepID=UPI0029B2DC7F|nr:Pr6Pr family membrane protein [Micrococcus sp. M4NT]MDX2342030.1 Pr6Pr family membrane protein [Micrococcus sp. M4NT]
MIDLTPTAVTATARLAFAVAAVLSLGGNLLSFWIGWHKDSDLDAGAGYSHVFAHGWENLLNQPTYFTFLSNFLVGITSLLLALRLHRPSTLFRVLRLTGVACIVITGVVFNLLLRDGPSATPLEGFNDTVQHIVTPILTPLLWAVFGPRRQTTWRVVGLSTVIPLAWLAFTLVRGPWLDWYPYTILDVPRLGYGGVLVYVVAILGFFVAVAALLRGADAALARAGAGVGADRRR